jgi:IclR family acetate operon transcriptional repressor
VTTRTLVDTDELAAEARRIVDLGHAVEDGEFLPGLRGVAVPVRDASGAVPASLAVAGPDTELELDLVDGLVELLQARASEIERTLQRDGRG